MDLPIVVLVIEDEQIDFTLLQRALREFQKIKLVWESTLAKGLARLSEQPIDVVLLDLSLPDSTGLNTIDAIAQSVSTPIVVMSNTKDEQTAFDAVKHGAQDYLFKDQMEPLLLSRTLRYAVERYNLLAELHSTRQINLRETELQRLKSDESFANVTIRKQDLEVDSYKDRHPKAYKEILTTYQELLLYLMRRREYQVKPVNVSELLKQIASALGRGSATPHDAIGAHTASVRVVLTQLPEQKNELCHQEARYLLSGLLGHLCYYYKHQFAEQSMPALGDEETQ